MRTEPWASNHEYPTFDEHCVRPDGTTRYTLCGYAPDMVNLALNRDDPAAFHGFLKECGFTAENMQDVTTLDGLTLLQYCEKRGAEKCKESLVGMVAQ